MTVLMEEEIDPRVLRTRRSLHQALERLLSTRAFENISVQEIAEGAGVNRATFYDHYADKFGLLACMVGERFHELLKRRGIRFEGDCAWALKGVIEAVCDYVAEAPGMPRAGQTRSEPHMQTAVIAVVRRNVLEGLLRHPPGGGVSPEILATTVSWAIYGAAQEWALTAERCSSEEMTDTVMGLVGAMMQGAYAGAPA